MFQGATLVDPPTMTNEKPTNPMDRRILIMDLFDEGRFHGSTTVEDLVKATGGTSVAITRALRALRFEIARRASTRRVRIGKGRRTKAVKVPRQWAQPKEWPRDFALQRSLRRAGMSAGAITRVSNSALVPIDMLEKAALSFVGSESQLSKRGKLKGVINELLQMEREQLLGSNIGTNELLEALGETGGNRDYLLNRVAAFAKRDRQYREENEHLKARLKALEETLSSNKENDNECISGQAEGGVFALPQKQL